MRRGQHHYRPIAWLISVLSAAGLLLGCSQQPDDRARPAAGEDRSPRAAVERLLELRQTRQYRRMPALVIPRRGAGVVEVLVAIDDFLVANRKLCGWVRDHVGIGLSQTIDQSYVADDLTDFAGPDLAIFSQDVELLDEFVADDRATISFLVGGKLPSKHVRLRRINGAWLFDPGKAHSEHLPAGFHEMARGLELALGELRRGRISIQELRNQPELLADKVKARLRRGVGLLSRAMIARKTGRHMPGAPSPSEDDQ